MTKRQFSLSTSTALAAAVLAAALCGWSRPSFGQSGYDASQNMKTQQQPIRAEDQGASSVNTFSGKITRSGNRFVLSDADNRTTYQLDDQQKARDFLNKNVKVTGALDASTGTIRITTIQSL